MTMYNISNIKSGADLGNVEADSPALALDHLMQDAGYRDFADALHVEHGEQIREWLGYAAEPGLDIDATVDEAIQTIAADLASGTDGSYELSARLTVSGRPECYHVSRELVVTEIEG